MDRSSIRYIGLQGQSSSFYALVSFGSSYRSSIRSSIHLLGGEALQYYLHHMNPEQPFAILYAQISQHYDTETTRALYHSDWSSLTFVNLKRRPEMAGKSNLEVLQALFDKLQLCQRALGRDYNTEQQLVDATLRAVGGVRELSLALTRPEKSFEALCSTLRSTLRIAENARTTEDTFLVDRRFQQSRERQSSYMQRAHNASNKANRDRATHVSGQVNAGFAKEQAVFPRTTQQRIKRRQRRIGSATELSEVDRRSHMERT